jgi:hypothetical protein
VTRPLLPVRLGAGSWRRVVIAGTIGALMVGGSTVSAGLDAAAASGVTVHFKVSISPQVVWYGVPLHAVACNVTVASGANGVDVLAAAVRKGCIMSYTLTGPSAKCVDKVCRIDASGLPAASWLVYENRVLIRPYPYGPDLYGFVACDGCIFDIRYVNLMLD